MTDVCESQHCLGSNELSRTSYVAALMLAGLFFLSSRLDATSLVALIDDTNHRLVIAADCRVNRAGSSVSECKIVELPNCDVAIAGLYHDTAAGFHLRDLVHTACQQAGSLREKAETFVRIARIPYEQAVRGDRDGGPAKTVDTMTYQPTEVVFAGIEDGHLALIVRGLVADPGGKVRIERFDSVGPMAGRRGYFLGLNGHIRAYVKSHPDWVKQDYSTLARQFVQMEIMAHQDLAGPPISELEIDEAGHVHWLDKGACEPHESD